MNSAPFRTKSTEPPKLRAFGSGNGASFAERAAAFKVAEPVSEPVRFAPLEKPIDKVLLAPKEVLLAPTEAFVSVSTTTAASGTTATAFSNAPKLSAAATAAYVPKNARSSTNTSTNTVVLTPDMFPALPSKTVSKPVEATVIDASAPKKMTFAELMKKRVAQDAIEAEQAERDRLRELARKEREERDLRSLRIQPRRNYYDEDEHNEEGDYNDEYHPPAVRGYDSSNYGHHEEEEEDHAPPMDEEEWND